MTSMIDVVFLLLVFFMCTFEVMDRFTNMEITRPSAEGLATEEAPEILMYQIEVMPRVVPFAEPGSVARYALNGRRGLSLDQLEHVLSRITPEETIMISCATHSVHHDLVTLMDRCMKYKLVKVSVVSQR